jgi:hypothetical protein
MPKELLYTLKKVWVSGQQLKISPLNKSGASGKPAGKKAGKGPGDKSRVTAQGRDNASANEKGKRKLSLKKKVRNR